MASWILVPCLVGLRNEFNTLAPRRDRASDGSIGDTAHSRSSSDHNPDETGATPSEDSDRINEVHAIDVDSDLRRSGWTMTRAVQVVVLRHRNGQDDRLQNVIYNRIIWSRSWGWTARAYNGANAHTQHAHFSSRYTSSEERDTRPWGLLAAAAAEDDMDAAQTTAWANSGPGRQALANAFIAGWTRLQGETGVSPATMLWRTYGNTVTTAAELNTLAAAIAGVEGVDEAALATELAPLITAQLIPAVTAGVMSQLGDGSGLTEADVEAAAGRASEAAVRDLLDRLSGDPAA